MTEATSEIENLRREIDALDKEILNAIKRRAEVSRKIGAVRMAAGGTKMVHNREMAVINRYSELGEIGRDLALILLKLGRGQLGKEV